MKKAEKRRGSRDSMNGMAGNPIQPDVAKKDRSTVQMPGPIDTSDPLPRRTDKDGNRLPWSYAFDVPLTDAEPVDKTPLAKTMEIIERDLPGHGSLLRHFLDHRLGHAVRLLDRLRRRALKAMKRRNTEKKKQNAKVDDQIKKLSKKLRKEERMAKKQMKKAGREAFRLHAHAASAFALAGVAYDPKDPKPDAVLSTATESLAAVAGKEALAYNEQDAGQLKASWRDWANTAVIAVLPGASIGANIGSLDPGTLLQPAALAFWVVGAAILAATKDGLDRLWCRVGMSASPSTGDSTPSPTYILSFLGATLVTLTVSLAELKLEQAGVLAFRDVQADVAGLATGQPGPPTVDALSLWALPMVACAGFIIAACLSGYSRGRHLTARNKLEAAQFEAAVKRDRERRNDPKVQLALTWAGVASAFRQQADADAADRRVRIDAIRAEIAALERQYQPLEQRLPADDKRAIQDLRDEALGAQRMADRMFMTLLPVAEPLVKSNGGNTVKMGMDMTENDKEKPRKKNIVLPAGICLVIVSIIVWMVAVR